MKEWLKNTKSENLVAYYVLTFCFGYLIYISSSKFDIEKERLVGDIKMCCITTIGLIGGYFFGASRSGTKKDDTVDKLIDHNKTMTDEKNSNPGGS